jgi:hypothetical protein
MQLAMCVIVGDLRKVAMKRSPCFPVAGETRMAYRSNMVRFPAAQRTWLRGALSVAPSNGY